MGKMSAIDSKEDFALADLFKFKVNWPWKKKKSSSSSSGGTGGGGATSDSGAPTNTNDPAA